MADNSAIEWTDATVNFWWGCTKVGPGCDHCYAETWDRRTGGAHWGHGIPRRKIAGAEKLIHRLDNQYSEWAADYECARGNAKAFGLPPPTFGPRQRVFIQSMSDLFDLEVDVEWFREAWRLIKACDRLEIQVVTKRISAVEKRLAEIGETEWPKHAGLIITVVNQDEADRDVPRLLNLKAKLGIPWVGLSCEPLLGPVNISDFNHRGVVGGHSALVDRGLGKIDWVIAGGESGAKARPMSIQWARELRHQCAKADVPFFFKQFGEWRPAGSRPSGTPGRFAFGDYEHDRSSMIEVDSYPRQFTMFGSRSVMERVGKKAAGRHLDGKLHSAMPVHRA